MTGRDEPRRLSDVAAIADEVRRVRDRLVRPALVGISGFGGAGKSTLAAALSKAVDGSVVVPGDEFLRERPTAARSDDWQSMDRQRLLDEVVLPTRRGAPARYQRFDWEVGALGPWVVVDAPVVVVEGLGLFHPDLAGQFDLRVWVDVDLDTATAQGRWRDEHVWGNPQTRLWLEVWKPNDADFFDRFRPDLAAGIHYAPGEPGGPDKRPTT